MDRRTNPDAVLGSQTTGQAQHFRTTGLHMKVADRARIGTRENPIPPAKYRALPAAEHRVIQGVITPAPELTVNWYKFKRWRATSGNCPIRNPRAVSPIPY